MPIPSQFLAAGNSPLSTLTCNGSANPTLLGAGNSQATATQVSDTWNNISSAPASGGVKLPPIEVGAFIAIFNTDSDTQAVYPFEASGVTINAGASVTLAQNKTRLFFAVSGTQWFSMLGA